MDFIFVIAKVLKTILVFIGNALLSAMAWTSCILTYIPFIFIVYIVDFGINYHSLPNLKQYREIFKKVSKGLLFPSEKIIRKIGYFFVLPLLKAEKEEDNPVSSMFSKYFNAKMNKQQLTIAHEYIDSIHRKNTYFTAFTFLGCAFLYLIVILLLVEVTDLLGLVGTLSVVGGTFGMASSTTEGLGYGLFGVFGFTYIISSIFDFLIIMLSFSMFLCVFWCFKEIKTQKHLNEFIAESLKLMVLTLQNNFQDNDEVLEIIDISKQAVIESANPLNEDDIFVSKIEKNFVRLR